MVNIDKLLEKLKENTELLNFIKNFCTQLRDFNQVRISYSSELAAQSLNQYVSVNDRRLDSLARILEGDEVCAAVCFDGKNLLAATNKDKHSMRRFQCELWDRLFVIYTHLKHIAKLSRDTDLSITTHDHLTTLRKDVAGEVLLSSLFGHPSFTDKKTGEKKINEHELREFCWKIVEDFARYQISAQSNDSDDLVNLWVNDLRTRIKNKTFDTPERILKYTKEFIVITKSFFRDLLKLENFISQSYNKPLGDFFIGSKIESNMEEDSDGSVEEISSHKTQSKGQFPSYFLEWKKFEDQKYYKQQEIPSIPKMIDNGGIGVHAEMRILAELIKTGKKVPYIGISKLCCALCSYVMQQYGIEAVFERDDPGDNLIRGYHSVPFPWPIHDEFKKNIHFLKKFFGKLYDEYSQLSSICIDVDRTSMSILDIIAILPLLKNNEEAKRLGIILPEGETPLAPDPSISNVHYTSDTLKGFYLLDEKRAVFENDAEFSKLQKYYKNGLRALLFEVEDNTINNDLWYNDNHINGLLEHYLPQENNYRVITHTQFENAPLLLQNINQALGHITGNGNIAILPLHLHGNHWMGVVIFRDYHGNVQVIITNPTGYIIDLEPNAVRFVAALQEAVTVPGLFPDNTQLNINDLHYRQQGNGDDCGPFTVDNLVRIAQAAANGNLNTTNADTIIDSTQLQKPEDGRATLIRETHHNIDNTISLDTIEDIENEDLEIQIDSLVESPMNVITSELNLFQEALETEEEHPIVLDSSSFVQQLSIEGNNFVVEQSDFNTTNIDNVENNSLNTEEISILGCFYNFLSSCTIS